MKNEVTNANDLEISTDVLSMSTLVVTDQNWRTSISEVKLTGTGSLECTIERPNTGDANGGYLMLYLNGISVSGQPVIRQYFSGKGSFKATISSNEVDFTKHNYVLCYAPHYIDNIRMVVTSVQILFGRPINLKMSACVGISVETDRVTSYYLYDSNPLGYGFYPAWIIVREGAVFGQGRQVGILQLNSSDPAEGTANVRTEILKKGQTYNVTSTLYSTVRPVAGYTFTVPK